MHIYACIYADAPAHTAKCITYADIPANIADTAADTENTTVNTTAKVYTLHMYAHTCMHVCSCVHANWGGGRETR